MESSLLSSLKTFDAYPKTLDDYRVKTYTGALVSVLSGVVILSLFISEFSLYLKTEVHHELYVDSSFGEELQINLDITFPKMPCSYLSVDAMDVSGEHQSDIEHNLFKKRLDQNGAALSGFEKDALGRDKPENKLPELPKDYCGSCYGSEEKAGMCCNTCEEVRESYRKKGWAFTNTQGIEQCTREGWTDNLKDQANEGCNLSGHLKVSKVAGNFHIAPGKSFQQHHMHVHDLQVFNVPYFNMSHTINRLSFGRLYPGINNPLDKQTRYSDKPLSSMWSYYVKVVPTTYNRRNGQVIATNQFSVTEHFKSIDPAAGSYSLPGLYVSYDISPMVVSIEEKSKSFAHFLTGVCAIVGGVYTVAGIFDSFMYHGMRTIQKKMELGKAN